MAKLTRVTAKVFGENASLTVGSSGIGQFGSAKAGTFNITGDVATIQALPAWSTGFRDAVTASSRFPALEEMTGLAKVLSYQNAYVLQEGISEWDAGTTYNIGSIVKVLDESNKVLLYQSIINDNLNTPVTNDTAWEKVELGGGARNIGEIVASTIPLTDAGLHLLDGALIQGSGIYSAFVDYIAGLVSTYPNLFVTESAWQTAVSTYGVCGKFVYDSVNNTVRLPKITGIVEGTTDVTALGDLVQAYASVSVPNAGWGASGTVPNPSNAMPLGTVIVGSGNKETAEALESLNSTNNGVTATGSTVQPQTIKVLYYIVIATSTKTSIEVDIDEIATDLNGKADVDLTNCTTLATVHCVVETFVSGTSWCRVYDDKWCEQGGGSTGFPTISLLKPYANSDYTIQVTRTTQTENVPFAKDITTSSFVVNWKIGNQNLNANTGSFSWMTCGYIA